MKVRMVKGVLLLMLMAVVVAPTVAMADHEAPESDFQVSACTDADWFYFRHSVTMASPVDSSSGYFTGIGNTATQGFTASFLISGAAAVVPDLPGYAPAITQVGTKWATGDIEYTFSGDRIFSDHVNAYYFIVLEGKIAHGSNPYVSGEYFDVTGWFAATSTFWSRRVIVSDCPLPVAPTAPTTTVPVTTTTVPVTTTTVPVTTTTVPVTTTTVAPTTVAPTTVAPTTTTIPTEVLGVSGDTLPETGSAEDLNRTAKAGIAFLLFGLTFLAASREVRVAWKDH